MDRLIDLSHSIDDLMPYYPGDSPTQLVKTNTIEKDGFTNYQLTTGMHSGTHLDGPMHLTNRTKFISEFPLESFIGEGCLLDVRDEPVIGMKDEYRFKVKSNCIVLLYTGYDSKYGTTEYYEEQPVINSELAEYLISQPIKILGIDLPSPDRHPFKIHKLLLQKNILILENLTNLDSLLEAKRFEIMAFPLKIKADSSLLRVVAKVIE